MKAVKELRKKRKKEGREDIFSLSTLFHFGFLHGYSVARNVFLNYLRTSVSPKSVVEIHKLFLRLICPLFGVFTHGMIHSNSMFLKSTVVSRDSCDWWKREPTCYSQNGYDTKNLRFRENAESPMMSGNKMLYICHERTSVTNTQTIFWKGLILLAFQKQSYYHWIKYIIFKISSLKYKEVFHFYLHLIKELPVYRNTSLVQAVW